MGEFAQNREWRQQRRCPICGESAVGDLCPKHRDLNKLMSRYYHTHFSEDSAEDPRIIAFSIETSEDPEKAKVDWQPDQWYHWFSAFCVHQIDGVDPRASRCNKCEQGTALEGDYLCQRCRYG